MLNKKVFNDGIKELIIAFPGMEVTKERAEVWYKYSQHLTDIKWQSGISHCIQHCYKNSPVLADIMNQEEDGDIYETI